MGRIRQMKQIVQKKRSAQIRPIRVLFRLVDKVGRIDA
jgi:hypothetical protein